MFGGVGVTNGGRSGILNDLCVRCNHPGWRTDTVRRSSNRSTLTSARVVCTTV